MISPWTEPIPKPTMPKALILHGIQGTPEGRHLTRGPRRAWLLIGILVASVLGLAVFLRLQQVARLAPREARLFAVAGVTGPPPEARVSRASLQVLCSHCAGEATEDEKELRRTASSLASGRFASTPSALGALGVASLLLGKPDEAVVKLEKAVRSAPGDASLASDLAAAYLSLAAERQRPYEQLRALSAADTALRLDPDLSEALYNRALALESLSLAKAASLAWQDYLRTDFDSVWAEEARRRVRSLTAPSVVTTWDACRAKLAQAALAGNRAVVRTFVERFTQDARLYAEDELLPDWGEAVLAGKPQQAEQTLVTARRIGEGLAELDSHEVEDAVAAIARAVDNPETRAALAEGHQAYRAGRKAFGDLRLDAARASLEKARLSLERGGSPFAAAALFFHASSDYNSFNYPRALDSLDRLRREFPLQRYPVLSGQREWTLGVISYLKGEANEALIHHQAALAAFTRGHEIEYEASVHNLIALDLEYVGETVEAWSHHDRALRQVGEIRSAKQQYEIFLDAATTVLKQGMPETALLFEDEAVAAARRWQNAPALAEVYWWRSRILRVLGRKEAALTDLDAAQRAADRIVDPELRQRIDGDLGMVEGEALLSGDPGRAVDRFNRALDLYGSLGSEDFLGDILLARAKAYIRTGEPERARADLERGVELYEGRRLKIQDERYRISYFDQSGEIFDALVGLEVDNGKPEAAFDDVERARARALLELAEHAPPPSPGLPPEPEVVHPWSLSEVRAGLPPGVALIEYAVLPDRLLAWIVKRDEVLFRPLSLDAPSLATAVARLRAAIERGEPGEIAGTGKRLYAALIAPLGAGLTTNDTLVFVPDKDLHNLPFAALVNPETGRFLLEERPLGVAPSATLYVRSVQRDRALAHGAPERALLVGNPAIDHVRYKDLPFLGEAEREATAVSSLYGDPLLLLSRQATAVSFRQFAPSYEVLHLAAHALQNREAPAWSRLLLAPGPEGEPGELNAWEIQRLDLRRTRLAVLSACSTAGGTIRKNEGVSSLASSFLAAGAPAVLAPLWDVDDHATTELMIAFHRGLRQGQNPANALRMAQLEFLHSADKNLRTPAAWSAFQLIGGTSDIDGRYGRIP